MGSSLFGGGTSKVNSVTNSNQSFDNSQNQNSSSVPAGFQMPFITKGLDAAAQNYDNAPGFTPLAYTGLSQGSKDALGSVAGFANQGAGYAPGLFGAGAGLLPAGADALQAGRSAYGSATTDPTQTNITSAGAYANNPYTQGIITAAQRPIERQLNEVAVPNLNISAAGTGNTDSSRAAMTEAILRRSAGEDESDVASKILGSQYDNGLSLAEGARSTNLQALLASMSGFNSLTGTGASLIGSGNGLGLDDLLQAYQASLPEQQDANASNKVAYDNALGAAQYPWSQLGSYFDIAGHPLGQTTTGSSSSTGSGTNLATTNGTQTQPGPGVLGGLLGLGTGIGSFFAPTGAFGTGPSLFNRIKSSF
jgi:hypothetical protein